MEEQTQASQQLDQQLDEELFGSLEVLSIEASSSDISTSVYTREKNDESNSQITDESGDVPIHYVNNAARKRQKVTTEDEPLIDTTAALAKNSKKTARMQKRLQKKEARKVHSEIHSLLDFPQELLLMITSFLQPSDIFTMLRLSKSLRTFVLQNERAVADEIMARRYWVLKQCFLLPIALEQVPPEACPVLMSDEWQYRLRIHKNPYQHIKPIDPWVSCTCMSCVLAWNYLNIILDLAHWSHNLENREPLPIIPRGKNPEWNVQLLERHAAIVRKAMTSPLVYARILQKHLRTTTATIIRSGGSKRKGCLVDIPKPRTYGLTDTDATTETDEYLERKGPESYQHPYMRDNYYNLEAFVPNRKWRHKEKEWAYYTKWPQPHLNDLNWLMAKFDSMPENTSWKPTSGSESPPDDLKWTNVPSVIATQQIGRSNEPRHPWFNKDEYEGILPGHAH